MSTQNADDNYGGGVGYKRPPTASQFKPGHSGHRQGRPRGSKSNAHKLREIFETKISVTQGGRKQKVSVLQALLLALNDKAVRGDVRAIGALVELGMKHEVLKPLDASYLQQSGVFIVTGGNYTEEEYEAKFGKDS